MKFPDILPPSDLLKQVDGIESGLRQRQRLGVFGLLAAALQVTILIAKNDWFENLLQRNWTALLTAHWPSLLILAGVVITLLLSAWARFWLQESQEPFRYTYSIADFKAVLNDKSQGPQEDRLSFQMSHDLSERLNERIKRLSLLDEGTSKSDDRKDGAQGSQPETQKRKSHIHIRGFYVIRQRPDGQWFIEVMPRVRIGPAGSSETLAHPVKFKLPKADGDRPPVLADASASDPAPATAEEQPPRMNAKQYEQILERVYFSVATEIYKQLQDDVRRKIDLLPTNYFRAVALFHEAEDYANSNTLDAYQEAQKLYDQALRYFDPDWKPLSKFFLWRRLQRYFRKAINIWLSLKRATSLIWPRMGRIELMSVRAQIGFANMLLFRRVLAGLSGQRVNTNFEAPLVVEKAVRHVRALSNDVPERKLRLFDAYVTLALAHSHLGAAQSAEKDLVAARAVDPLRADTDKHYLFVCAEVEPRTRSKLPLYRRAVELDPRFEVAQFSLAYQVEMLWRSRPQLERAVAELVIKEYEAVTTLNPGSVGAWANQSYVRWLLAAKDSELRLARATLEDGREYKEIKRETFVAELDHGLARIAAEQGDFEAAYRHYIDAVSATLAQGESHGVSGGQELTYFYELINRDLLQRIIRYKNNFEENFKFWATEEEDGHWRNRTLDEIARDLSNKRKNNIKSVEASQRMRIFLRSISARLSEGDRQDLAAANIDLAALSEPTSGENEALAKAIKEQPLAGIIEKYLPTLRVRKSVYAFVLNDFGVASRSYYLRSGSEVWREAARQALETAKALNPAFAVPLFHLYQLEREAWDHQSDAERFLEKAEADLKEIVDLEPDWPDPILALAEVRAERAKQNSIKADEANKQYSRLMAEVAELETRRRADRTPAYGLPAQLASSQIVDPLSSWRRGSNAAPLPAEYSVSREDPLQKRRSAEEQKRLAAEYKQQKRLLAKEAVDAVRLLLPFGWAEQALNQEIESSTQRYDNASDGDGNAVANGWTSRLFAGRKRDLSAEKAISDLLNNPDIRWERDLEDIHVNALHTWAKIRPLLAEGREVRREKGRVILKGEELLCHIRHYFWPDNWEVHTTLRELAKPILKWQSIPGTDDQNLRDFLAGLLAARWPKRARVETSGDTNSITVSRRHRTLRLRLDRDKSQVAMTLPYISVGEENGEVFLQFEKSGRVNWSNIPGSHQARFVTLLREHIGLRWLKNATVAKNADDSSVTVSAGDRSLSLTLELIDSSVITHKFPVVGTEETELVYREYEKASTDVLSDSLVRFWQKDRHKYATLTWIADKTTVEEAKRREIFSFVSKTDDLPRSLYLWLGDQWFEESNTALAVFGDAVRGRNRLMADRALKDVQESIERGLKVYCKAREVKDAD